MQETMIEKIYEDHSLDVNMSDKLSKTRQMYEVSSQSPKNENKVLDNKSFINKEDSKDLTDNSLILSDDKNPKKLKKIKSYEKLTLLINE